AALLAAAGGIIHVRAAIEHGSHWWFFGVFFWLLVYGQLGWAVLVGLRGRRDARLLDAAIYGSVAIAAVWLLSRTVGIPVGPWAWDAERVGAPDTIATLDELVLAALLCAVVRPEGRVGRAFGWMRGANAVRVGIMLASASVLALALGSHAHQ
ncbi:MAG: hypothetical protein ACRDLN_08205, partial [Solirubrobacteraceae bacterium]